jgi:hypothetical protein
MSGEQTVGLLFRRPFLDIVSDCMGAPTVPCFVEDLNAQWGACLWTMIILNRAPTLWMVSELSSILPLLQFLPL